MRNNRCMLWDHLNPLLFKKFKSLNTSPVWIISWQYWLNLFSCSVMFDPLLPHGLQHTRLLCPSLHHLLEFAQTHVHWVNDAIQPSHPLSPSSPARNLSQRQGLFQWVDSSQQVAKVLELQLQHQSSNEYSRLISFRIDWFDYLAVQGTLKSLPQHHSLKTSILWCSVFFMV